MLQQQFITMNDYELTDFIKKIYQKEAEDFETTVEKLFDMNLLRTWFRLGCPDTMPGMSPALIKFASTALYERGLLD